MDIRASSNPFKNNKTSNALTAPNTAQWILWFGVVLQTAFFIAYLYIGQVHVDEAMLLLNARSLAEHGTDILGEKLPVYFDTWLYGGQSPLATYLAALFIKIFGYQLWISRLPIFLCSLASLFAMRTLLRELFGRNLLLQNCILLVTAIAPWRLFQGAWTLDCAYLPHMLILALCFLAKAVNGKQKALFFALSMLFFALGFYAYIASVFLIPVLLVVLYLLLLGKKKIKFRHAVWSAAVLLLASLPFILFGLVQTGILDKFTLLGFSFSPMGQYTRGNTTTLFGNVSSLSAFFSRLFQNLFGALGAMAFPDAVFFKSLSNPSFAGNIGVYSYAHTLGGAFAVVGCGLFLWENRRTKKARKKSKLIPATATLFLCALLITFFVYAALVNYAFNAAYRYAAFYPLLHIFEGICLYSILQSNKHRLFEKLLAAATVCALVITAGALAHFAGHSSTLYGKDFESALQTAKSQRDSIVFADSDNPYYREREAVFLRFYCYDESAAFTPLETELLQRGALSKSNSLQTRPQNIKADGSWRYDAIQDGSTLNEHCYIFFGGHTALQHVDEDRYSIYQNGYCTVLIKK